MPLIWAQISPLGRTPCARRMVETGCDSAYLTTDPRRVPAINLYLRSGNRTAVARRHVTLAPDRMKPRGAQMDEKLRSRIVQAAKQVIADELDLSALDRYSKAAQHHVCIGLRDRMAPARSWPDTRSGIFRRPVFSFRWAFPRNCRAAMARWRDSMLQAPESGE